MRTLGELIAEFEKATGARVPTMPEVTSTADTWPTVGIAGDKVVMRFEVRGLISTITMVPAAARELARLIVHAADGVPVAGAMNSNHTGDQNTPREGG